MNTVHLLALMRDDSHTVVVKFNDPHNGTGQSKGYTYKALKAWGVQKGDTVVVDTQYGMKTAEVVEAHDGIDIDFNAEYNYKWIVCRVNVEQYTQLAETDKEFAEAMRQIHIMREREKMLGEIESGLNLPEGSKARELYVELKNRISGFKAIAPQAPQYGLTGAQLDDLRIWVRTTYKESFDSMSPDLKKTVAANFKNLRGI